VKIQEWHGRSPDEVSVTVDEKGKRILLTRENKRNSLRKKKGLWSLEKRKEGLGGPTNRTVAAGHAGEGTVLQLGGTQLESGGTYQIRSQMG